MTEIFDYIDNRLDVDFLSGIAHKYGLSDVTSDFSTVLMDGGYVRCELKKFELMSHEDLDDPNAQSIRFRFHDACITKIDVELLCIWAKQHRCGIVLNSDRSTSCYVSIPLSTCVPTPPIGFKFCGQALRFASDTAARSAT